MQTEDDSLALLAYIIGLLLDEAVQDVSERAIDPGNLCLETLSDNPTAEQPISGVCTPVCLCSSNRSQGCLQRPFARRPVALLKSSRAWRVEMSDLMFAPQTQTIFLTFRGYMVASPKFKRYPA